MAVSDAVHVVVPDALRVTAPDFVPVAVPGSLPLVVPDDDLPVDVLDDFCGDICRCRPAVRHCAVYTAPVSCPVSPALYAALDTPLPRPCEAADTVPPAFGV